MLRYDGRIGQYVDDAGIPAQQLPPAQAFGGASPSDLQRFYDEVAFYTGQPAMQQVPVARQAIPAQAPLAGQPTIFDQPGVLDVRQAQMQPQQPQQPLPGEPQIMTRAAVPESQPQPQPTQESGPGAEEIIQDVATEAVVEVAKDEIKKEIGVETASEGIKEIAEWFYPGSTSASTSGASTAGQASSWATATPETQAAWNAQPSGTEAISGGGGMGTGAMVAEGAGWAAAAYNVTDAVKNIAKGSRRGKGAVEGTVTTAGAVAGGIIGAAFGMPGVGAGIGSIIGRTVGRGMASLGESLGFVGGRTTTQYQIDRWTAAMERASTIEEQKWAARQMNRVIERKEKGIDNIHDEGVLKGREWSLDDVHGLGRGEDVWGDYAFFEAFPDWLTGWTEQERRIISEAAIREKLLSTDKGSILFSGKRGHLARIQEIGYQVKQGTYVPAISDEQRMQDRAAYAQQIGVDWDPSMDAEADRRRAGEHMQMMASERQQEAAARAEQAGYQQVQGQALWKPNSERDGNLVMLFPYPVGEVTIRDANTGQVLAVGQSSGPSNGFADTIRFDRPGGAFQNVIVEDRYGNSIPISDGSQRMEGIPVTGYAAPSAGMGAFPSFGPPPVVQPLPPSKPRKKINYKKRELPKVTYQAPKAPEQPKAPAVLARAQQSKEK